MKISILMLSVALIILFIGTVNAAGYGNSNVSLSQNIINISQGGSASIGFKISLVSGSTWGTSLSITPLNSYITFSPNPPTNDPPYSGDIIIKVASNTPIGKYKFNVSAIGDDPSVSAVNLIVYVSKATSNTTKIVTPITTTTKPTNYFSVIFAIFIVEIAALLGLFYILKAKFSYYSKFMMIVSVIISLASALYLLIFDSLLRTAGMVHYDILIVFFIGTIALTYFIFTSKKNKYKTQILLGALSALFVLAMFLDAFLGLPLTSISGSTSYSLNYLFGFGSPSTNSTFSISLAFSLLLLSVTITAITSLLLYPKKR